MVDSIDCMCDSYARLRTVSADTYDLNQVLTTILIIQPVTLSTFRIKIMNTNSPAAAINSKHLRTNCIMRIHLIHFFTLGLMGFASVVP